MLFSLGAILLSFQRCTLEKEPAIPVGESNVEKPVFSAVKIISDSTFFLVSVHLDTFGALNILEHGWVWGKHDNPSLQSDSYMMLGSLTIDSFVTEIRGLNLDQLYHIRPFVITGLDTIYGRQQCSFLGVNFSIDTDTEIFKGAVVTFSNHSLMDYEFSWIFGDGNSSQAYSPVHQYLEEGSYTVCLKAESMGYTVERYITLTVMEDPFEDYWVPIPGGTFTMGCTPEQGMDCDSSDEFPSHQVVLSDFMMGETEITQAQWEAIMKENRSNFIGDPQLPVETVSWKEIKEKFIPAFKRKTGQTVRLPTEAEWEYAARGGADAANMTKYSGSSDVNAVAWYDGNSANATHPVRGLPANGFGLYDMSGNVSEWCFDLVGPYENTLQINPQGSTIGSRRVRRGGSWYKESDKCRVSARKDDEPGHLYDYVGFRLVRDP